MEQYTLNKPNGLGHFVPEMSSPLEEVVIKELAKFQAEFVCENSCLPQAGLDYTITPALPNIQDTVYLGACRDLLNMDYATTREEIPGRMAALYIALAKIFDMAEERAESNSFAREISGIAAAAFGDVQHGRIGRDRAKNDLVIQALRREVRRNDAIIRAYTAIQDGANRMLAPRTALMHVGGILESAVADINGASREGK